MAHIKKIHAREILDSRGNPTVEVDLVTDTGITSRAMVPSGASTGVHEALELRDGDANRYSGKGVLKAVNNVNTAINKALYSVVVSKQKQLDEILIKLDGTETKSHLGANAILGASIAAMKAAAQEKNVELYEYIGDLIGNSKFTLPVPMMNIINGGKHADSGLDIQEFMIVPAGASTFREALRMGAEVFHALKKILAQGKYATSVGDEGGYAPSLPDNRSAFECITKAITSSGYKPGKDVMIAIDSAASEFYNEEKGYLVEGKYKSSTEMINFYESLINEYPIISIEDGLAEDDWTGWIKLTKSLGTKVQLVGDDLFVTNKKRLKKGIESSAANAVLIKLNQIGTVTETLETIKLAHEENWHTVISHRSGETVDTTIADLSVGVNSKQIKTGSLCRQERVEKYNQLLRIEENLGKNATYASFNAFK